jgi:fructose/tagatose bisphosphate aldolase
MPLISNRAEVLAAYADAAKRGWVVPCFGSENLTTSEAVLEAALRHAALLGVPDLPVTIAITGAYEHRSQASFYTHTRQVGLGLRLFLADLRELTAPGSPYARLRVMAHFDHAQHDLDAEALASGVPGPWASVMYDASTLAFAANMAKTRAFVERRGREVVIEGACDEIVDSGSGGGDLTSPERAATYLASTGVDLMVANLGTEHRASGADLRYRGDLARACSARVGGTLVLHGCSSVPPSELGNLFTDGVRKVNIWTMLERDASPALLADLVANADKVGGTLAAELAAKGLLGPAAPVGGKSTLSHFTTVHRQDIIHAAMVRIAAGFYAMWYR